MAWLGDWTGRGGGKRRCPSGRVRQWVGRLGVGGRDAVAVVASADPFPPQQDEGGHGGRAEEEAEEAEGLDAAEDAEEDPEEGELGGAADEAGADEVVGGEDDDGSRPSRTGRWRRRSCRPPAAAGRRPARAMVAPEGTMAPAGGRERPAGPGGARRANGVADAMSRMNRPRGRPGRGRRRCRGWRRRSGATMRSPERHRTGGGCGRAAVRPQRDGAVAVEEEQGQSW